MILGFSLPFLGGCLINDELYDSRHAQLVGDDGNGFSLERKPASIAFHYRNADEQQAHEVLKEVMEGPASYEGVFTRTGKKVVELGVSQAQFPTVLVEYRLRSHAVPPGNEPSGLRAALTSSPHHPGHFGAPSNRLRRVQR